MLCNSNLCFLNLSCQASRQLENDDCFTCHIVLLEALVEEDSSGEERDPSYSCITKISHNEGGRRETYDITLTESILKEYGEEIEEGLAHICIPGGYISEDSSSVVIPNERRLRRVESTGSNQRRLQQDALVGTKKLLAVRVVSASGEEPAETLAEIRGAIFGAATFGVDASNEYAQTVTAVSQFKDVSAGALKLQAATGTGIVVGVVQVVVDHVVAGGAVNAVTKAITAATEDLLGGSLDEIADHVIFCLPNDSILQGTTDWTAFTYLYEPVSANRSF